jgi:hypothetical protein
MMNRMAPGDDVADNEAVLNSAAIELIELRKSYVALHVKEQFLISTCKDDEAQHIRAQITAMQSLMHEIYHLTIDDAELTAEMAMLVEANIDSSLDHESRGYQRVSTFEESDKEDHANTTNLDLSLAESGAVAAAAAASSTQHASSVVPFSLFAANGSAQLIAPPNTPTLPRNGESDDEVTPLLQKR